MKTKIKYISRAVIVLFSLIVMFPYWSSAAVLYTGKSDDVFIKNTAKIKEQKILAAIVSKIKKQENRKLNIILTYSSATKNGEKGNLGERRFEKLKKYFLGEVSEVQVTGRGNTLSIANPVSYNFVSGSKMSLNFDMLRIDLLSMDKDKPSNKKRGIKANKKFLLPWQITLRDKYLKKIEKRKNICKEKEPKDQCAAFDCKLDETNMYPYYLCSYNNTICEIKYGQLAGDSLPVINFRIRRLKDLRQSSVEVYEIAAEIMRKDHSYSKFFFNTDELDREIRNHIIAKKYIIRALKINQMGLKTIMLTKQAGDDGSRMDDLDNFFGNWDVCDTAQSELFEGDTLGKTLERVKLLHNYIRKYLDLPVLIEIQQFPICMTRIGHFFRGHEDWKNQVEKCKLEMMKDRAKYGIQDIPLE